MTRRQEEAPQELLKRVGSAVEVPHRRRGAEIHGEVVPKGDAVPCAKERAALRRHPDRPLPVRIEEVSAAIRRAKVHEAADVPSPSHCGLGFDDQLLQELTGTRGGKAPGRVLGPTKAPAWLDVQAAAIPEQLDVDILEEPPPREHFLAGSFAVCQTDEAGELKVRRAEDWRRSPSVDRRSSSGRTPHWCV